MTAAVLGLALLALGALVVLASLVSALTGRRRTPATLGCALAGAALLVVWTVLTSGAAGRGGTVYSYVQWWALAVLAALVSLVLTVRGRRR
ncbi:hypothetical protein [Kineococcus sp. SYSU DK003]|uniref:hypothetical protein n=1 Tax=Kineococcus sp. SYSU DK003 TaxID=3383124 RepID=UPI003D7F0F7B